LIVSLQSRTSHHPNFAKSAVKLTQYKAGHFERGEEEEKAFSYSLLNFSGGNTNTKRPRKTSV
jgi:hypothetical protein